MYVCSCGFDLGFSFVSLKRHVAILATEPPAQKQGLFSLKWGDSGQVPVSEPSLLQWTTSVNGLSRMESLDGRTSSAKVVVEVT